MLKYEDFLKEQEKEKILECDECKKKFPLTLELVQVAIVKNEKDEAMKVTFFACPYCFKVYVVFIEDAYAKRLQQKIQYTTNKILALKRYRKPLPRELKENLEKLQRNSVRYQTFLKEKYGEHFTLKRGSDH